MFVMIMMGDDKLNNFYSPTQVSQPAENK